MVKPLIAQVAHEDKPLHTKRNATLRAVYAEFVGTIFMLLPIVAIILHNKNQRTSDGDARLIIGLAAGLNCICLIMCFSGLSGAIFNPAITFSLWIAGKISNRKCFFFILVQMLGSIACMLLIYASFPHVDRGMWEACVIRPADGASSWHVFFTEFLTTFILTYCAFAMAFEEAESLKSKTMSFEAVDESDGLVVFGSTPQSKVGFAPFAIGFVVFVLSQYGGGSGASMNPARMFGPAIMTNIWDSWGYYVLGEFLGASAAGLLVSHGPQSGDRLDNSVSGTSFSFGHNPVLSHFRESDLSLAVVVVDLSHQSSFALASSLPHSLVNACIASEGTDIV